MKDSEGILGQCATAHTRYMKSRRFICPPEWARASGGILVFLFSTAAAAFGGVITFEDLPDAYFFNGGGQNIQDLYPGITLGPDVTGLSVTRFGGYANEAFPPNSGDVVIWDATDPTVTIDFASTLESFGIWYTSYDPLTLQAFDASGGLVGVAIGNPNTDGTTGTTSFLSLSSPGIASVGLTSAPGLFTLDDLTYQSDSTTVPEPSSFHVLTIMFLFLLLWCVFTRRRSFSVGVCLAAGPFFAALRIAPRVALARLKHRLNQGERFLRVWFSGIRDCRRRVS